MKKIITTLIITTISLLLSACMKSEASTDNYVPSATEEALNADYDLVSIIVDIHKYAPLPDFSPVDKTIINVCSSRGRVMITETGGEPYVAYNEKLPEDTKGTSSITSEQNSKSYALEITEYAKTLMPTASENDMLKAISLSLKKQALYGGNQALIISGPGIFTRGNFTMSYLMSNDTETVIQKLESQNVIPHIDGDLTVIWVGLGEPSGEQPKPSENDLYKMENFYREYFLTAGAKEVYFIPSGVSSDWEDPSYPDVSIYEFPNTSIIGEDSVEFIRNSSEFVDPDKASAAIESIAKNYNVGEKLLIAGFASSEGTATDNIRLSEERARVVSEILSEKGLKTEYVGKGFDSAYCITDTEDGVLDESKASKNRKILVMRGDSDEAQELINNQG